MTEAPPVSDKGPVCVGEAPAGGVRVLRGGGFRLPGGMGVQYAGASADGSSRTATFSLTGRCCSRPDRRRPVAAA